MTAVGHEGHAATLRDYLHVVRRRKWIILIAVVLVPAAAIAYSVHQQKLYQADAKVLLNTQNLANQLTGTAQYSGVSEPQTEVVQTQAEIARVPAIAARVLGHLPETGLTTQGFLNGSTVSPSTNADILNFAVTNHNPGLARELVNAYATAYTVYRRQLDTAAIHAALTNVDGRINRLTKAGGGHSSLYSSLVQRQETLSTMAALQTSNAAVVQQADKTELTQPKTKRNTILGIFLGLVLGIGLAFLWEALDTRVRNAEEIGERLGHLPLLARVPVPAKRLRARNKLVMLDSPTGIHAETFRMLRTNLDFATLGREAKAIMVTSAVEQEGKSTTIANLAVALARSGKRVVLVDLDLRRPILDRFFNLSGPGITEVALGRATLDQAIVPVPITEIEPNRRDGHLNGNGNGNGNSHVRVNRGNGIEGGRVVTRILEVLPAGPIPPDPGEFVATPVLTQILDELRDRADIVLIDAPPVLHVGDAMTLSAKVDGVIVVTRMKVVRRHMLNELARQLATSPTPILGYVVTAADEEQSYGYGYGYGAHAYGSDEQPAEKPVPARSRS